MLTQLVYISTPLPEYMNEVTASFPKNQIKNRDCGVTGMILSHRHFYLQLLEGDRCTINKIYNKIVRDTRHANVVLLRYQEVLHAQITDCCYAVVNEHSTNEFEYIADIIDGSINFEMELAGATAMGLLRRAAAIVLANSIPQCGCVA